MALFAVIFIVPLLVGLGAFLISKSICRKELMIMIGVQIVIAASSAGICYFSNTRDVEVWNGVVVKKLKEWTSCTHSYSCNCRPSCSGSGTNRTCSTTCDTCYEHFNDWDWNVYTSNGESISINRVDRRGTFEPPRWTKTKMGEPTAVVHSYDNYIKASPDSLFRHQGLTEKYAKNIPAYPNDVYDYYRLNRLVLVNGAAVPDPQFWNVDISALNAKIGWQKQVNVIVVLVKDLPREYFYALEEAWIGAKKNDVVVVAGVNSERKPQWVEIMAWTVNPIFKIKLRDAIMEFPVIERWNLTEATSSNILMYHRRKPMAEFEYLKSSITPSTTQWIVTLIIGLIVAVGMSIFFHQNETFFEYRTFHRNRSNWP